MRVHTVVMAISLKKSHNEWGHIKEGLKYEQYGYDAKALSSFSKALGINPYNTTALTHKAGSLYRLSKYPDAASAFDDALQVDPKNIDALHGKGLALEKLKMYSDALDCFEQVLEVDSTYKDAISYAALCMSHVGMHDKALASLDDVISKYPDHISSHYCKSRVLSNMGRVRESIMSLDAARVAESAMSDLIYQKAEEDRMQKRYHQAVQMLTKSLHYNPENTRSLVAKGWLFDFVGMPSKDVIPYYRRAIASDPHCTDAHLQLGLLYDRTGLYKKAVLCFDEILKYDPTNTRALYSKGVSLYALKERAAAVFFCESALRISPDDKMALCSMAWVLEHDKKYEAALQYCDMAIAVDKKYAYAHSYRGKILYMLKRYKESLQSYQTALGIDPDNKTAEYYFNKVSESIKSQQKAQKRIDNAGKRRSMFGF